MGEIVFDRGSWEGFINGGDIKRGSKGRVLFMYAERGEERGERAGGRILEEEETTFSALQALSNFAPAGFYHFLRALDALLVELFSCR